VTLGRRLMPAWERDERLEATIDRLLVERGNDPAEFEYREEKEAQASQPL
jgi:predicted transcriptional regulator